MTTVQITLPDELAREADNAGLLAHDAIARLLRERLRADRIDRMRAGLDVLTADPPPPMTPDEINAEIEAYRAEQRRATAGFRPILTADAGSASENRECRS